MASQTTTITCDVPFDKAIKLLLSLEAAERELKEVDRKLQYVRVRMHLNSPKKL